MTAGAHPRNPAPTVDVVIFAAGRGIVLVERKNPPPGWALPGGFVDYGETCETAAVREAKEETGLDVVLTGILGVYSDPARDPRGHTMSVAYTAQAVDLAALKGGDDARRAVLYPLDALPPLAFDHGKIVQDFIAGLARLAPHGG
jgi:8-oxo-dGTP diphosphatase